MTTPVNPSVRWTRHARRRACARRIGEAIVEMVMRFGRVLHHGGVRCLVVGRREVRRAARLGLDLSPAEGVHLVVADEACLVTLYRNRSLEPARRFARRDERPVRRRKARRRLARGRR